MFFFFWGGGGGVRFWMVLVSFVDVTSSFICLVSLVFLFDGILLVFSSDFEFVVSLFVSVGCCFFLGDLCLFGLLMFVGFALFVVVV